jgi:hypothetical protein
MRHLPLAVCIGLLPAAQALAQQPPGLRPFVSVTPLYQFDAEIDSGGEFSVAGAVTRVGVLAPLGQSARAGVGFNYDYLHYRFDAPAAFGGAAPWDNVERVGVSVPLFFRGSERWSWSLTPSADYFREKGADWDDALSYGATFAVTREFASGRIGLGAGVFSQLEKTRAFPFIAIDYKFNERWRLTNPLAAGPTGPAGLELKYALGSDWELGAGGAWRSYRFRLDDKGIGPAGVGEEQTVIGFLHLGRSFERSVTLDLYAGATFAGELRVEDSNGNELATTDFDPAPLLGVTISARF